MSVAHEDKYLGRNATLGQWFPPVFSIFTRIRGVPRAYPRSDECVGRMDSDARPALRQRVSPGVAAPLGF